MIFEFPIVFFFEYFVKSKSYQLLPVWLCGSTCFSLNFNFFFLLKLSAVCTFWIVLMCWCQKWFLKNKKTSLACISARKAIWKTTTTTLTNTLISSKLRLDLQGPKQMIVFANHSNYLCHGLILFLFFFFFFFYEKDACILSKYIKFWLHYSE